MWLSNDMKPSITFRLSFTKGKIITHHQKSVTADKQDPRGVRERCSP